MVVNGQLSLGVPCAPFTLTRYTVVNGKLTKQDKIINGRKFPLKELREKMLKKQEQYMRLSTDNEIEQISTEDLRSRLSTRSIDLDLESVNADELREMYKKIQRNRTLVLWHDHATILGLGIVMLMVHVAYDSAVFLTQSELECNSIDIQATVETPMIHLLAAGTSSIDDQAALLQDRIDCLKSLSENVTTSNGIEISDQLVFFYW